MDVGTGAAMVAAMGLALGVGPAAAQTPPADVRMESAMRGRAAGTFEVKVTPIADDGKDAIASARLALDKVFQGDLVGTSRGQMWTADTGTKGSAGYVAIEKVEGTLGGRRGGFTLLHQGTMRRGGEYNLAVVVVPDSATGELAGLAGKMTIVIAEGRHSYELDYTLPAPAP